MITFSATLSNDNDEAVKYLLITDDASSFDKYTITCPLAITADAVKDMVMKLGLLPQLPTLTRWLLAQDTSIKRLQFKEISHRVTHLVC